MDFYLRFGAKILKVTDLQSVCFKNLRLSDIFFIDLRHIHLVYQTQEELQFDESIGEQIAGHKLGVQNNRATCLHDFRLPPRCR